MANKYGSQAYRSRREALKRKCRAEGAKCYLCLGDIDYDAPRTDPKSFEADHVESLTSGGKLLGKLLPSCKRCNGRKQGMSLEEYRSKQEKRRPSPTRRTTQWE